MSFDRTNNIYRSLPINAASQKSVNFTMPQAANKIPITINTASSNQQAINSEEFAKLDALLEDLLAEVEQPIFLNKDGAASNNWNHDSLKRGSNGVKSTSSLKHHPNIDDIERSVDWLNEQKEKLRNRKEMFSGNLDEQSAPINSQPYRKIKTKLDYYVSNSNENNNSTNTPININKAGFSYTNPDSFNKLNNHQSYNNNNESIIINNSMETSPTVTSNGTSDFSNQTDEIAYRNNLILDSQTNTAYIVNNKPPVSPNSRLLYSPTQQQQQQQQAPNVSSTFRSISTNPTLLKNINEMEDENNMIDSEFDRYSQRSFRSTSTVQRTKYHTVSNDYTECTKPSAPTPVPTLNRSTMQSKRALSAPPTEVGKVVLQRMELKSPLTVRQGSVVPFEQRAPAYPDEQIIQQRVQTPNGTLSRQYIDNPYNNRGILKTNGYPAPNAQLEPAQAPIRNVFLNRAYSETPRVCYTNGYETDSGVGYRQAQNYNTARSYRNDVVDSDSESYRGTYRHGDSYSANTGAVPPTTYRTLGPASSNRYQIINDQSGYDTDTGLIKLRHVLDNNRRASSRNNMPIQQQAPNGYYYQNRSVTPSFAYNYNPQGQFSQIPVNDGRMASPFVVGPYPTNEFIPQTQTNIQFVDANGNVTNTLPAYVSADGRQIIVQEIDPNRIVSSPSPAPQSLIIQQQVAPSAYPSQSAFHTASANSTSNLTQLNREAPSRLTATTSATNLSQKQQASAENGRATSAMSLADSNEVYRSYPKSVKSTQGYWYKPKISRDEAIALLKDKQPGTFLIRDSNNFPGAYGLALKVDKPPPNVQLKAGVDPANELVRHFLIEPTTKGVRIKGCCNEPIFGNLAALVYHHSMTPLALPIKLILPTRDLIVTGSGGDAEVNKSSVSSSKQSSNLQASSAVQSPTPQVQDARVLLDKGAACNVFFLNTVNVESRSGLDAITYALNNTKAFVNKDSSQLLLIQFKVTSQGITLTDMNRKKFIRQHFPTNTVNYCAVDEKLAWPLRLEKIDKPRIFGVISKPRANGNNECHLFVEMDPDQPAIAIVDFINRYLIPSKANFKPQQQQ